MAILFINSRVGEGVHISHTSGLEVDVIVREIRIDFDQVEADVTVCSDGQKSRSVQLYSYGDLVSLVDGVYVGINRKKSASRAGRVSIFYRADVRYQIEKRKY